MKRRKMRGRGGEGMGQVGGGEGKGHGGWKRCIKGDIESSQSSLYHLMHGSIWIYPPCRPSLPGGIYHIEELEPRFQTWSLDRTLGQIRCLDSADP